MFRTRHFTAKACLLAAFALAITVPLVAAQAKGERVLHSFDPDTDGFLPSGLIRDRDGNLYGTADARGQKDFRGVGTVFGLAANGTFTVFYRFKTKLRDGKYPIGGLARDKAGNLYGATSEGGGGYDVCEFGCGTVFRVAPDGTETVLHAFAGSDGDLPVSTPLQDGSGNFYGTTEYGGADGDGVVFRLAPDGTLSVLHSFDGSDGAIPQGDLLADKKGNLYGATFDGGSGNCAAGCGVIYKLAPGGTLSVLHSFQGLSDGSSPDGPLVRDADGNLYGTTVGGGSTCGDGDGCGVAFKLAPDGTLTVLHVFTDGSDGGYPEGGVIADGAGNLYGVTVDGGLQYCQAGCGVVFKLAPDGTETVLRSFDSGKGGFHPEYGLTMDKGGNLYGTTWEGGANGDGTIFEVKTK
ncbi:MAG TPA: choice-of-anchor tandem repeat GloVer-containing protein [Rhizomicrobium sp.]|jgi:uncharacterized repeat protein (TIGR03803 family)